MNFNIRPFFFIVIDNINGEQHLQDEAYITLQLNFLSIIKSWSFQEAKRF